MLIFDVLLMIVGMIWIMWKSNEERTSQGSGAQISNSSQTDKVNICSMNKDPEVHNTSDHDNFDRGLQPVLSRKVSLGNIDKAKLSTTSIG